MAMKYSDFSREQLLARLEELDRLNTELLAEKEQEIKLEYAWTGNLGHWYWDIKTNAVTFNPLKVTNLGYKKDEIPSPVTYQYFTDKLHPDDYDITMEAMKDHLYGRANVYEAEYRIQAKDGKYKWYYDRGRITQYDDHEKPIFLAGIVFDITKSKETQMDLENKNKILAELSFIDGLTKISNHRMLVKHLKAEIADASKNNKSLTIAIFDIDDFKKVNDSKGHLVGDQVLKDVAAIIKNSIRDTDLAGRYGGEEFVVVFSNTDIKTASRIAERIKQAIEGHSFIDGMKITVSGGIKQFEGENLSALIHGADKNLYKAKKSGKNRITA